MSQNYTFHDTLLIFNFLFNDNDKLPWTFRVESSGTDNKTKVNRILNVRFEDLLKFKTKVEVHATLNATKLNGRVRKEDFVGTRVLAVDLDRELESGDFLKMCEEWKPHVVVETSPKKYHFYWKLEGDVNFNDWSAYQITLAALLGGDPTLGNITHQLRVPGFWRESKDWTPRIVSSGFILEGGRVEVGDEMILWNQGVFLEKLRENFEVGKKYYKDFVSSISSEYRMIVRSEGAHVVQEPTAGRHNFLYFSVVSYVSGEGQEGLGRPRTMDEALEMARGINKGFKEPLSDWEVSHAVEYAWQLGVAKFNQGSVGKKMDLSIFDKEDLVVVGKSQTEVKQPKVDMMAQQVEVVSMQREQDVDVGFSSVNDFLRLQTISECDVAGIMPYMQLKCSGEDIEKVHVAYRGYSVVNGLLSDAEKFLIERFGECFKTIEQTDYVFSPFDGCWHVKTDGCVGAVVEWMFRQCMMDLFISGKFSFPKKLREFFDKINDGNWLAKKRKYILEIAFVEKIQGEKLVENPELVGCLNGTFSLLDGSFRQTLPSDYLTGVSNFTFDVSKKGKSALGVRAFLKDLFELSCSTTKIEDVVDFMLEVFAVSLSREKTAEVFFHYGAGGNGKSTLIDIMGGLFGDYYKVSDSQFFYNPNVSNEYTFSGKRGKRMVLFAECDSVDEKAKFDTNKLKAFGELVMEARSQYERKHLVVNQMVGHFTMNSVPELSKTGLSVSRRIVMIPYKKVYSNNVHDKIPGKYCGKNKTFGELKDIFIREQSELLWELSVAYRRWVDRGKMFKIPVEFVDVQEEYMEDQDRLKSFLVDTFEECETMLEGMYMEDIQQVVTDAFISDSQVLRKVNTERLLAGELKRVFFGVTRERVREKGTQRRKWSIRLKKS